MFRLCLHAPPCTLIATISAYQSTCFAPPIAAPHNVLFQLCLGLKILKIMGLKKGWQNFANSKRLTWHVHCLSLGLRALAYHR
jgi:hypothetical protein